MVRSQTLQQNEIQRRTKIIAKEVPDFDHFFRDFLGFETQLEEPVINIFIRWHSIVFFSPTLKIIK